MLIKGHHEEYISWEEFQRNQRLIADNANRRSNMGRGSIRRGEALLAGLFRCARCGRKLKVSYSTKGGPAQRYVCGAFSDRVESRCLSFAGIRIDRTVAQEVLDRLQPLGIEAAMAAMNDHEQEHLEKRRQLENALEQARFEAARAHRQYDQVDPDNRLVAGELERRWNKRLANVRTLEEQLAQYNAEPAVMLSPADRERLLALGRDLPRAWHSVGASVETRKKILRLLIEEIVVDVAADNIELVIHWRGGDHTRLSVKKNKAGQNRWATDADVVELVRILARQLPDESIAAILNRSGKLTGRGNSWTRGRVCALRQHQRVAPYREGKRAERGEVTLNEAAAALSVSPSTILRMLRDGALPAQQLCKGAPWIIRSQDLKREDVRRKAEARSSRRPPSCDPLQKHLLAVGAHPDDDEQRDRSRFAVEPHPHNGAVENEAYDRLIGERAGAPGLPIALHLAPNTAHRVLTDRTPEQRSERTPHAAGVGAGKIAAGDQRVGRERATLIGSQRVAFPLGGLAFRSIEPSAGHLELQLPEGPQQRARAMAVPVTSNVRCLLRIAACSHPTTSIARAAKRYLKLCFEHRLQEFAGAIPEVRFNRVEPVVEKVTCSLGLTLRLVSGRAMACHGVISAGICRNRLLDQAGDYATSEFQPLAATGLAFRFAQRLFTFELLR